MPADHSARSIMTQISKYISDRLGGRKSDYLVSDSASAYKSAVRMFYGISDDSYCFPCCVHLCQLAIKEAVASYLSCNICDTDCTEDFTFDELSEDEITSRLESTQRQIPFEQLTTVC